MLLARAVFCVTRFKLAAKTSNYFKLRKTTLNVLFGNFSLNYDELSEWEMKTWKNEWKLRFFWFVLQNGRKWFFFQTYKLLSKVNCCKVAEMTNKMEWPHSPLRQISTVNNLIIIQEEKKSKSKKSFGNTEF